MFHPATEHHWPRNISLSDDAEDESFIGSTTEPPQEQEAPLVRLGPGGDYVRDYYLG